MPTFDYLFIIPEPGYLYYYMYYVNIFTYCFHFFVFNADFLCAIFTTCSFDKVQIELCQFYLCAFGA